MWVYELMTRPAITTTPDAPLEDALALLDRHAVAMLPVVDRHGRAVGIFGEADVLVEALNGDSSARLVGDIMSRHPVTVTESTDMFVAAELMTSTAIKSLPVVDEAGKVVGVVSRHDVVHVLARSDYDVEREVDERLCRFGGDWLVDVQHGEVTITGPVGPHQTFLADATARRVPGVRQVSVRPG